MATETESLPSLSKKIVALEKSRWGLAQTDDVAITPELRRARRHTEEARCYSSSWTHCPGRYYSLGLEERRAILGASSTSQLCKGCLFENKNFVPDGGGSEEKPDPSNSRYYLVVVQYVESIDMKALASELRGLRPPGRGRFDPGYFADLRLAPEEASERLTGYGHNGVSPFGMLDRSIPVIVCKSIESLRPRRIWMGGGHRDWKLSMAVSEFVKGVNGIVLDVSKPRTAA